MDSIVSLQIRRGSIKIPCFFVCQRIVIAFVLLAAVSVFCAVEQAQAAAVLRPGYIMQMADSDKTAAATSDAKNSRMILWNYRPTATWAFRHLGGGTYTIRTNSFSLHVQGGVGSSVTIASESKNNNQKWRLKQVGKYYQIINVQMGLAMELANGQRTQGSKLQANTPNDSREQLFCIQNPRAPRYCGEGGSDESYQEKKGKKKGGKRVQPDPAQPDSTNDMLQGESEQDSGTQSLGRRQKQ